MRVDGCNLGGSGKKSRQIRQISLLMWISNLHVHFFYILSDQLSAYRRTSNPIYLVSPEYVSAVSECFSVLVLIKTCFQKYDLNDINVRVLCSQNIYYTELTFLDQNETSRQWSVSFEVSKLFPFIFLVCAIVKKQLMHLALKEYQIRKHF